MRAAATNVEMHPSCLLPKYFMMLRKATTWYLQCDFCRCVCVYQCTFVNRLPFQVSLIQSYESIRSGGSGVILAAILKPSTSATTLSQLVLSTLREVRREKIAHCRNRDVIGW